jgi:nucleoside-diphosphate-sugar epimerase
MAGVRWHQTDLLDRAAAARLIREVRPSHLLHLAWTVEHGAFWTSPDNLDWLAASLHLLRCFNEAGGSRFLGIGSGAEYGDCAGDCDEAETPLCPASLYAAAKSSLWSTGRHYAQTVELGFVWCRLFQVFGVGEPQTRLIPSVIGALLRGEVVAVGSGTAVRDFVDVRDAAAALKVILLSDFSGALNVGTGRGRSIAEVCESIGRQLGRPELIGIGRRQDRPGEPGRIVADVARLRSVNGELPATTLEDSIADVIGWLSEGKVTAQRGQARP